MPTLKGDQSILKYQLKEEEVLQFELNVSGNRKEKWQSLIDNFDPEDNKKICCGCGLFSYMISVDGFVRQCNFMVADDNMSILENDFNVIWDRWKNIKQEKKEMFKECLNCKFQPLCDICPSIAKSFQNDLNVFSPIERYCKMARLRYEWLQNES